MPIFPYSSQLARIEEKLDTLTQEIQLKEQLTRIEQKLNQIQAYYGEKVADIVSDVKKFNQEIQKEVEGTKK